MYARDVTVQPRLKTQARLKKWRTGLWGVLMGFLAVGLGGAADPTPGFVAAQPSFAQQEQSTAVHLEHTLEALGEVKSVPLKTQWTKADKSFQVKNLLVYKLPENFPVNANFRGIVGTISTTTTAAPDGKPVWSETLWGLAYTKTGTCPVNGQKMPSYEAIFSQYPSQGLTGLIIKQVHAGTEKVPVAIELPVGIPMQIKPGDCLYTTFDGTDFAGRPYTLSVDLHMLYDTLPSPLTTFRVSGVDAEFLMTPNTWFGKVLNAYSVSPVGPGGQILPGEMLDVSGNAAAASSIGFTGAPVRSGRWSERVMVVVYRKPACEKAFPHHPPFRFLWNDQSGARGAPNPSSALWPENVRILDYTLTGTGIASVMKQGNAVATVPVHLNEGDCVAAAFLPNTDNPEGFGSLDVEEQFKLLTTP